jgi:hypothetical protein
LLHDVERQQVKSLLQIPINMRLKSTQPGLSG